MIIQSSFYLEDSGKPRKNRQSGQLAPRFDLGICCIRVPCVTTAPPRSVQLKLFYYLILKTACLVQWLSHLTAIQEVPGSIPGYTQEIFLEVQGLERGPPSVVRTIWQLLDMRSSENRLRKLKLRMRDKRFANHKAPCTAIWQQPLQSVLALRVCSATYLFNLILKRNMEKKRR